MTRNYRKVTIAGIATKILIANVFTLTILILSLYQWDYTEWEWKVYLNYNYKGKGYIVICSISYVVLNPYELYKVI